MEAAGFLRFDPASEFEILESLDFEEEIQRPESLRFFTLDEQLLDYFDKVLPKKGKVTKYEYMKIAEEVDRLREVYNSTVTVTDSDYVVDLSRKKVDVDWVKPIYTGIELTPYSFAERWNPLYGPSLRTTSNFYPRMLAALPKPYKPTGTDGVPFVGTSTLVNEEGKGSVNVLGTYERTRGVVHEDGTFSVVKLPITNTADEVRVKGFYVYKRPLDIPSPLAEHPFFASNEPHSYLTEETLERVFPTIEAIMTHGVPRTNDPYKEGSKFLKLYDVKLSQIPWNLWRDRFPPVGPITVTPPILSIAFAKGDDVVAPSKTLTDIYTIPWMRGIEPRQWLTGQEDGGALVSKMLLTKAAKAGLLPPAILGETPQAKPVASTPEECFTFDTLDGLVNAGLYRLPKWSDVSSAVDKGKPIPSGTCIPMPQVIQEKSDMLVAGKIAWKDDTPAEILRAHQELLKFYQSVETPVKQKTYEKYAAQEESETRRLIKAVLADPERESTDKASAIEVLLTGVSHKEEKWFDAEDKFLICGHTIGILKGDLAVDEKSFYETWSYVDDGFRACKFCGEQISSNVLIAQDDFDGDGNAVINYGVLDDSTAFKGEGHVESFSNSLNKLRPLFNLDSNSETIIYLLLSLLQVLPEETQLLPIIQFTRKLVSVLKANTKIEKSTKEKIEGILGIVGIVTLLLTHNPFLIPRRSFGSKILKLSGFPRDTDSPEDAPALDIVISVLKTTFQASPSTFKGGVGTFMRKLIAKPKEIRKDSIGFLKQTLKDFAAQYASAKERYAVPVEAETVSMISFPVLRREKNTFKVTDKIGEDEKMAECNIDVPRTYITGRLPPNVRQAPMTFSPTAPTKRAKYLDIEYKPPASITFKDEDIRGRLALGFPKGLKLEKIESFIKSDTDGASLLALLNRLLDILAVSGMAPKRIAEYRAGAVYLKTRAPREAARGLLYELFHEISGDRNKTGILNSLSTASKRDLGLKMIFISKDEAARQDSDLRTREREVFKMRMRNMNDMEREITKMLLDIGIAPYVITNEDREIFAREYNLPDPEAEYTAAAGEGDLDRPEDGYNAQRDVDEDGAAINATTGLDREVDYGQYGDRREEPADREYERNYWTNLDEGDGF